MGLTNTPFTIIGDVIPVLLIAIGTAPCIHILSKFNENTALYGSRNQAAVDAFSEVGFRVVLASSTIILGFASLLLALYLELIRDFGIFMCAGVFFCPYAFNYCGSSFSFLHQSFAKEKSGK